MYKIEKKDYGFRLTFTGFIMADEMKKWVEESKTALASAPKSFGVFVDMRTLKPLPDDSQKQMQEGQRLYKERGMTRSVVVVANVITKMQFQKLAKESGIYKWERYLDVQSNPDWETLGVEWIKTGKDPDLVKPGV